MEENSREDRINNAYCFLNSMHSDFRTGLYYKEDLENLEHILSDYKRVLKENNRLEEQVEYDKTHIYTPQTIELNFILKSKIEDKIEKLNSESYAEKLEDMMNTKNYTITELVQYVLQELLDGNDTNVGSIGNSIEEIETLEELRTHGYNMLLMKYEDRIKTNRKIDQALEHIVSDYKKVLKENEILKEEKEQAWEEWNNLEQGSYGTEQKLKQQIKELRKENEELKFEERRRTIGKYGDAEIHNVINKILSNDYIPIQKIKGKIEELDIAISECIYLDEDDEKYKKAVEKDKLCLLNQKRALQELLEGRE